MDVGSSAVRAAVLDSDGRLRGYAGRPLETSLPKPGRAEHDPRAWLAGALETGREAVAEAGEVEIVAVGVGALGPAPVLVDERLQALTPAPLFALDRRAEKQRARLAVADDHALPKLLWWQENEPGLAARAAWALDATGYLVAALTGEPVMDSITRVAYEHPAAPSPVSLPSPVDPLAIAGRLRAEGARRLGVSSGTPVAAGTFDTYVDIAGTGVAPGDACLLLGSTLAVYAVVTDEQPFEGLELTRYPGEGLLLGGTTAAAGSVLRWLATLLGGEESVLAAAATELEPGSGGLLALPYLAGERAPFSAPDARGALVGLSMATGRAEIYRAVVDALALSAVALVERVPERKVWRASGGGCKNPVWLQATCDALGAPVEVSKHAGEAVGPAVLALRSIGLEPAVGIAARVEPTAERTQLYDELYSRYRTLDEQLRKR
ncbi:MAG: xylulokinase [Gaiellaceae bacterium]